MTSGWARPAIAGIVACAAAATAAEPAGGAKPGIGPAVMPAGVAASRLEQIRKLEAFRANLRAVQEKLPAARLPADLETVRPTRLDGRTNLELVDPPTPAAILTPEAFDRLIDGQASSAVGPPLAAACSDGQFVRRVYLDVVGRLPSPRDLSDYAADRRPDRKERLVETLLARPSYGTHWGRYWRDAMAYRATAGANRVTPFDLEGWLADELNAGKGWDDVVRGLITAEGLSTESPAGAFVAMHEGKPEELAGEAARLFMGVQLSCAQCHDHPTAAWKRDQFHDLAAFFGKVEARQRIDLGRGPRGPVVEVSAALRRRDYLRPDAKDPAKRGTPVIPAFLSGQALPRGTTDRQQRGALATFLTSPRNPYFARAFVNRLWAELTGEGFVTPVDDLQSPATRDEDLFDALSRSFAASGYDVKGLVRLIVTSRRYDRVSREPDGRAERSPKAAAATSAGPARGTIRPTRLSSDVLFDALDDLLGGIDDGLPSGPQRPNRRAAFQLAFGYDPSTNPDDVDGGIPQALALANNPLLATRMDAKTPGTLLNRLLKAYPDDEAALRQLYLKVVSREPTGAESAACRAHRASAASRAEAFEDVLWSLLNSAEFLTNH